MMNRKIKVFLLSFFALILCSCKSSLYWNKACISADEKTIAVASMFYGAGLIDAQTGELIKRTNGYFDDIVCYENGAIVAFSTDKNVWLTEDREEIPGSVFNRDLRRGSGEMFYLKRQKKFIRHRTGDEEEHIQVNDGPPLLTVRKEGEPVKEENFLKLSSARFEGVGAGDDSDFEVKPLKVTGDGKLLAAAGFPVHGIVFSRPAPQVSENYWGIYRIDVENDLITPAGQLKPINDKGFLFGISTQIEMSEDEKLIAGVFEFEDESSPEEDSYSVVKVFEFPSMNEKFSARFDSVCSAKLKFSPDGSLLAIGSEKICWNLKEEKIQVFDLQKNQMLWQDALPDRPLTLHFFRDNSLMAVTSNLNIARYDAAGGALIWKKSFEKGR